MIRLVLFRTVPYYFPGKQILVLAPMVVRMLIGSVPFQGGRGGIHLATAIFSSLPPSSSSESVPDIPWMPVTWWVLISLRKTPCVCEMCNNTYPLGVY